MDVGSLAPAVPATKSIGPVVPSASIVPVANGPVVPVTPPMPSTADWDIWAEQQEAKLKTSLNKSCLIILAIFVTSMRQGMMNRLSYR